MDKYTKNKARIAILEQEIEFWRVRNAKGVGRTGGLVEQLTEERDALIRINNYLELQMDRIYEQVCKGVIFKYWFGTGHSDFRIGVRAC